MSGAGIGQIVAIRPMNKCQVKKGIGAYTVGSPDFFFRFFFYSGRPRLYGPPK